MTLRIDRRIAELQTAKLSYLNDTIDLKRVNGALKARTSPADIPTATVRFGEYDHVLQILSESKDGMIYLAGATGTGKSTFGLTSLFLDPDRTILLVQPNRSNVGNTRIDFNSRMPRINANLGHRYGDIPHLDKIDLCSSFDVFPESRLAVTTVDDFTTYVRRYETFPPFVTIILDEFHLLTSAMKLAATLLTATEHNIEVILTSATPPDTIPPLTLSSDVTVTTVKGFKPSVPTKDYKNTLWNPGNYRHLNGTIVYFLPTAGVAQDFGSWLRADGYDTVYVIDQNCNDADFERMNTDTTVFKVVILTPLVEAGVSINNIKLLIDSYLTFTIIAKDGVVYESVRGLTEAERRQRWGRAARRNKSYIIAPETFVPVEQGEAEDFFIAEANIVAMSLGIDYKSMIRKPKFADDLMQKIDTPIAKRAVKDTDFGPYVAAFRYKGNDHYVEFGGQSTGFEKDHLNSLRVYTYAKGSEYFIAPIIELVDSKSDPTKFMPDRQQQIDLAEAILKAAGVTMTFGEMIATVSSNPRAYVKDIMESVERNLSLSVTRFSFGSSTDNNHHYSAIFIRDDLRQLFDAINQVAPIYCEYDPSLGKHGDGHSFHCDYKGRSYTLGLNPAMCPSKKDPNKMVYDMDETAKDYEDLLRPIISVGGIAARTNKVTNLDNFVGIIPSTHVWFKANVG